MFVLAIMAAAATVFAQTEADFAFDTDTGTITKYVGWDTELVIPAAIGGKPVKAIGYNSFSGADLTSVTIPRGIQTIGERAFARNKLTSLTLPAGLVSIGESAFRQNSLTSVTIPGSVKTIGESAFSNNQLTNVVIPEGITEIGEEVFSENKLESMSLPSTLETVHWGAFVNANSATKSLPASITLAANITIDLCEVLRDRDNKRPYVQRGARWFNYLANGRQAGTYTQDMLCEEKKSGGFTYILTQYGAIITSWYGEANRLRIPADFEGAAVKAIWYRTVEYGYKESFIGSSASNLDNILLPEGLQYIGNQAFRGNSLATLNIPSSVTYIDDSAFSGNQLTSLIIPDSVTYIGDSAFSENQLTSVTLPSGVTHIGDSAFSGNRIAGVTIPGSLTHIGDSVFSGNRLTGVTISGGVTHIGDGAFRDNQLTSVTIPESVTYIGGGAFSRNKLTGITLPSGVTALGRSSFDYGFVDYGYDESNYTTVTSVVIGANVQIGDGEIGYGGQYYSFENDYIKGGKKAGTYTYVPATYSGEARWVRK